MEAGGKWDKMALVHELSRFRLNRKRSFQISTVFESHRLCFVSPNICFSKQKKLLRPRFFCTKLRSMQNEQSEISELIVAKKY